MARIVCLGAGTGQAQVLRGLRGVKGVALTAVVNVTDNGGHTGELRRVFGVPAVGDLRNVLEALVPEHSILSHLLTHRFLRGKLDGTSLGNFLLVSLVERFGSLSKAAAFLTEQLDVPHRVLPASDASGEVCARLEDGKVITGEWQIILRKPATPIRHLYHKPRLPATAEALREIRRADLIVFAPGSLYTGLLSCALAEGIPQALRESRGRTVYLCNLMTQPGQTLGFGARRHVEVLTRHLGAPPDVVVLNSGAMSRWQLERYGEEGAELVPDDLLELPGIEVRRADLVEPLSSVSARRPRGGKGRFHVRPHYIRHDPQKTARLLQQLL